MHCNIRIGDGCVIIEPLAIRSGDDRHVVTAIDTYQQAHSTPTDPSTYARIIVPTEDAAIAILQDFLQTEEPGPLFRQHFPAQCP